MKCLCNEKERNNRNKFNINFFLFARYAMDAYPLTSLSLYQRSAMTSGGRFFQFLEHEKKHFEWQRMEMEDTQGEIKWQL